MTTSPSSTLMTKVAPGSYDAVRDLVLGADQPLHLRLPRAAWGFLGAWDPAGVVDATAASGTVEVFRNPTGIGLSRGADFEALVIKEHVPPNTLLRSLHPSVGAWQTRVPMGAIQHEAADSPTLPGAIREMVDPALSGVWLSSAPSRTPMHADEWPGLLVQCSGRKSVTLGSFDQGDPEAVPWHDIRHAQESFEELAGKGTVQGSWTHVTLEPDHAVVIPAHWLHDVTALTASVSMVLRILPAA